MRRAIVILLAIGLAILLAATVVVANIVRFRMQSNQTTATYVDSVGRHSTKYGQMLYARFVFRPSPTQPVQRIVASNGTSDELFSAGDTVTVFFDMKHPEQARIATFYEMWLAPLVLAVPGVILVLIATVLAVVGRRQRRKLGPSD